MKIFLIGMPGSGKSTLGKALADALRLPFIDLDTEIEAREGKTISEIFSILGEAYFRKSESFLLEDFATSENSFVMATGGGAPCFYNGINLINKNGTSVFLDVSVEEILERLKNNTDRPLLASVNHDEKKNKLNSLRANRLPFYQQAKITITSTDTIENITRAIKQI